MTCKRHPFPRILAALASAAVLALSVPIGAWSAPASASVATTSTPSPATRISLDTSSAIIPQGSAFHFRAHVALADETSYLQARLRLNRASGTLIYQKTFVKQNMSGQAADFQFERSTAGLGLTPGTYPVELSVRWIESGEVTESVISSNLFVYGKLQAPISVATVIRISPQPMSDANGTFSLDPAQFTRARDDVRTLANYVLANQASRLTLCLSPMMLDEWRMISSGYRYIGAEGEITAVATDPVAVAYAQTLDTLRAAVETGRMQVLSAGYSDPDLGQLENAGLGSDILPQYMRGKVAGSRAVPITASGTAPARGVLPPAAIAPLSRAGVTFAIVDQAALGGRGSRSGGVFKTTGAPLKLIASDTSLTASIVGSATAETLALAFRHYITSRRPEPLTTLVNVGPGGARAEHVIQVLRSFEKSRWASTTLVSSLATATAARRVRLRHPAEFHPAPAGYWQDVRASRVSAEALRFALLKPTSLLEQSVRGSLMAESSAWQGFDGSWNAAGRGLSYAATAGRDADQVLRLVRLTARPITLAGAAGRVPVTIENGNKFPVRVTLHASPDEFVRPDRTAIPEVLQPGENFVEVPVRLVNSLTGTMRVTVTAGEKELASSTVSLKASYLDKLAVIAAIVVALVALLAFIIRRVRMAESTNRDA